MPEFRKEVKSYKVRMFCDNCIDGELFPTGEMFLRAPPIYEHKCNGCEVNFMLDKSYPYIEHEEIDSE